MGFTRSKYDPCLYIFKKSKTYTLLVIVVDDILLATNDVQHAKHFEREMKKVFDLKSMGTPKYMIGMNLSRSKNKLHISQKEYIRDLAHRFEVTNDKPMRLPASSSVRLVATGISGQGESPPINEKSYRSLVGALMYAILTRPGGNFSEHVGTFSASTTTSTHEIRTQNTILSSYNERFEPGIYQNQAAEADLLCRFFVCR